MEKRSRDWEALSLENQKKLVEMTEESVRQFFRTLPAIDTPRTFLRALVLEDAWDFHWYGRDPAVSRYLYHEPLHTEEQARDLIRQFLERKRQGLPHPWGVVWKKTGRLVGICGFGTVNWAYQYGDVGYELGKPYWGQGLMSEILVEVLRASFAGLGLHRIEADCSVENQASERVLQKVGMQFEGVMRGRMPVNGRFHDLKLYSMLAHEFRSLWPTGTGYGTFPY